MSLINATCDNESAHLITDGAIYDTSGKLISVGQKVVIMGHLHTAFSVSGAPLFVPVFGDMVQRSCSSFDDLIGQLPTLFRQAHDAVNREFPSLAFPNSMAVIAGWSAARDAAEVYVITASADQTTHGAASDKSVPFEVHGPAGAFVTPYDEHIAASLAMKGIDPLSPFDPAREGIEIARAQRTPVDTIDGKRFVAVGGFLQCTTIDCHGISTRILERWPDRIGERIAA